MTNIAPMSGMPSDPKSVAGGSAARLAEQVGIEAERLGGTMKDGVDAAQAASKDYRGLFMDTYVRLVRVSVRSGVDVSNHVLALMQVRTPADLLRINFEFMQKQVSSLQDRFFEVIGVDRAATQGGTASGRTAPADPSEPTPARPQEPEPRTTWVDGQGSPMIQS